MKTFSEYLNDAKRIVNPDHADKSPKDKHVWYAYKRGEVMEFDNNTDAKLWSSNIECVIVENLERKQWVIDNNKIYELANHNFNLALRYEYSDLPDSIYKIMMDYVKDCDISGYNDPGTIANELSKISTLVYAIINNRN